jgi:hypothetical protein
LALDGCGSSWTRTRTCVVGRTIRKDLAIIRDGSVRGTSIVQST